MIQIVAFIGFATVVVLFLSARYHDAHDKLQPKWWYAVSAICIACHSFLAVLIYEEFLILSIILFVCASVLSYITCKMAILHDRIQKRRGKGL